ncbi:hypothetical protein FRB99_007814 [Tulasnella sp. 403]|nr:hypothetical protein FRB99_007814 [Tulasnella sp. 403]
MRLTTILSIFTALSLGGPSLAIPAPSDTVARHDDFHHDDHTSQSLPDILDATHREILGIIPELRAAIPIAKVHPIDCPRAVNFIIKMNNTVFDGATAVAIGVLNATGTGFLLGEPFAPFDIAQIVGEIIQAVGEIGGIVGGIVNTVEEVGNEVGNVIEDGVNAVVGAAEDVGNAIAGFFGF